MYSIPLGIALICLVGIALGNLFVWTGLCDDPSVPCEPETDKEREFREWMEENDA